jgi:hypothetical protein
MDTAVHFATLAFKLKLHRYLSKNSQTHIVFRGLQRTVKDIFSTPPNTVDITLKQSLVDAHTKLSDYYYKFDASP